MGIEGDYTEHEIDMGGAFLAGERSQREGGIPFEDFSLACWCPECRSEFARGFAYAANLGMGCH